VISVKLELQKVPLVLGNSAELREVITNLVLNAVDAMPKGGTITLRTQPVNDAVQIEVSDDGTGMTEEVRARCLQPFFSTKGERGTGLGLSMSFGIIRRHEGTIEIDTSRGRGTTFRISLPEYQRSAALSDDVRLTLGRVMRVLVVDDDSTARDVVAQYLRSDGHRVSLAKDGGEAMQHMISDQFDLLITDQGMPGMSGTQLGEAARRVDRKLPVILLTGFPFPADQEQTSVDLILKKPLARDELRGALQSVLDGRAPTTGLCAMVRQN
jgi:CheY-like chemotaxis protein